MGGPLRSPNVEIGFKTPLICSGSGLGLGVILSPFLLPIILRTLRLDFRSFPNDSDGITLTPQFYVGEFALRKISIS